MTSILPFFWEGELISIFVYSIYKLLFSSLSCFYIDGLLYWWVFIWNLEAVFWDPLLRTILKPLCSWLRLRTFSESSLTSSLWFGMRSSVTLTCLVPHHPSTQTSCLTLSIIHLHWVTRTYSLKLNGTLYVDLYMEFGGKILYPFIMFLAFFDTMDDQVTWSSFLILFFLVFFFPYLLYQRYQ